jgi:hypothetical protein
MPVFVWIIFNVHNLENNLNLNNEGVSTFDVTVVLYSYCNLIDVYVHTVTDVHEEFRPVVFTFYRGNWK